MDPEQGVIVVIVVLLFFFISLLTIFNVDLTALDFGWLLLVPLRVHLYAKCFMFVTFSCFVLVTLGLVLTAG